MHVSSRIRLHSCLSISRYLGMSVAKSCLLRHFGTVAGTSRPCVFTKPWCDSYTMVCSPVRGDNPRALASGLSLVQADKP